MTTLTLNSPAVSAAGVLLQRGDNDDRRTWGGTQHGADTAGTPVHDLQAALRRVGAAGFVPDGDFGPKTQEAVRRFQWYLTRLGHRLRVAPGSDEAHGSIEPFVAPAGVQIDGLVKPPTLAELLAWDGGGFVASSPLVRLGTGGLSNVELAGGFTVLAYPSPGPQEMLVHQDFVGAVNGLNGSARAAGVRLLVNQSFRVQDMPPSGAVVPPATNSQHLIGHAVDLNVDDDGVVNTSAMFKQGTQTDAAKDFVRRVRLSGLRWGGDFSPTDPPHFDDFVPPSSDDYKFSFHFAQRSYASRHPIRAAA